MLATAASVIAIPVAHSAAYVAMPIYSQSPANGAHLPLTPRQSSTPVVIQSWTQDNFNMIAGIQLEVSTVNVLGQDGTLSDDFLVDYDFLKPSDTAPGFYTTRFQNWLYTNPGATYYYQFHADTYSHQFTKSPVFSFVYDPSATGSGILMSKSDAIDDLKWLVKHGAHHRAHRLQTKCKRTSDSSFRCRAAFVAGGWGYHGRLKVYEYTGDDGLLYWDGAFRGHRSDGKRVVWS